MTITYCQTVKQTRTMGPDCLTVSTKLSRLQKFILVDALRDRPNNWKGEKWDFDARDILEGYYQKNDRDVGQAYFMRGFKRGSHRPTSEIRRDFASARAAISRAKKSLINRGLIEITSGNEKFSRWVLTNTGRELAEAIRTNQVAAR